jgi:hypothetical protein
MWFDPADEALLYLNGCSGRYGPRTPEELEDTVDMARSIGYNVVSFGWDQDAGMPAKVLRR